MPRYVTDAMLAGLAKELRTRKIDCETIHKVLLGHEDSRVKISDPKILKYLKEHNGSVTLITADSELAEYCSVEGLPCIRVQDIVADYIASASGPPRGQLFTR